MFFFKYIPWQYTCVYPNLTELNKASWIWYCWRLEVEAFQVFIIDGMTLESSSSLWFGLKIGSFRRLKNPQNFREKKKHQRFHPKKNLLFPRKFCGFFKRLRRDTSRFLGAGTGCFLCRKSSCRFLQTPRTSAKSSSNDGNFDHGWWMMDDGWWILTLWPQNRHTHRHTFNQILSSTFVPEWTWYEDSITLDQKTWSFMMWFPV